MLLVDPSYTGITEAGFSPDYWGERASPVGSGGRGSAWFIDSDYGALVLRQYRRGGIVARLSERSYVYTGKARTRSFAEFNLLHELRSRGLPVPKPVAAWFRREHGLTYRAAILIERISGAKPLPEIPPPESPALWKSVGSTIRRFHDEGLNHVDLNCDNILVLDEEIYLIDFDRCRLCRGGSAASWKHRNLVRLRRSVDKRMQRLSEEQRNSLWQALLKGYDSPSK